MSDHERQSTDSSSNYTKVTSSIKLAGLTKVTLFRTHQLQYSLKKTREITHKLSN